MTATLWRKEKYHVKFYIQKNYNQILPEMREKQSYQITSQLISEAVDEILTACSIQNTCQHT